MQACFPALRQQAGRLESAAIAGLNAAKINVKLTHASKAAAADRCMSRRMSKCYSQARPIVKH
jgi:hypothetical protein